MEAAITAIFRKKFETYRKFLDESGEEKAWNTIFEGYPERQRKNMGRFIDNNSLAQGFANAIPAYKEIGMVMNAVDISNNNTDAVLEIQRVCPVLAMAREYGFDKPCHVICKMDVAATMAAFKDIKGRILSRIADGDCVCIFKYERKKKKSEETASM